MLNLSRGNELPVSTESVEYSYIKFCFSFQLAKCLKDLPLRIQSASIKERQQVIKHVISVLSNPGKL